MKKSYEVIWVKTAENDLLKIIGYIAQKNPDQAQKTLKKIKIKIGNLYRSPERCRVIPELYVHGITQYREMIISPWRIMYRIADFKVFILSVFDSRQNIEDILLKRLTHYII